MTATAPAAHGAGPFVAAPFFAGPLVAAPLVAALLVAAVLLLPATASADVVALRHGGDAPSVVVEAGWPDVTAAWWFRPRVGVGVDVGLRGEAVGLSVGFRHALVHGPRGWGVDVFLAGGLRLLVADPGVAFTLTPAIAAGSRGPFIATLGVALPAAARAGSGQARLPILGELRLGGQPGPVSFGVRGALGPVFSPQGAPAISLRWSAWFSLTLPTRAARQGAG